MRRGLRYQRSRRGCRQPDNACYRKRNKERAVCLGSHSIKAIQEYLALRNAAPTDPLFATNRGKRLQPRQLWVIFKQIREASGLVKHITPLTLRHSFATHMIQHGSDIVTVKDLLGHSNIASTDVYVNVSLEHQQATFERTHPRA
ncbi:MAG: tyrosine-type recombinase/integrase [Candidatus Tyrphobacter sp.]